MKEDADGQTVKDAVEDILAGDEAEDENGEPLPPVHHRTFAGRCPGIARNEAGGTGGEWSLLYVRGPESPQHPRTS